MNKIPLHSFDLIDELNQLYPEVIYDPLKKHEEFLMESGARRLVKFLLFRQKQDAEENNNNVHAESSETADD